MQFFKRIGKKSPQKEWGDRSFSETDRKLRWSYIIWWGWEQIAEEFYHDALEVPQIYRDKNPHNYMDFSNSLNLDAEKKMDGWTDPSLRVCKINKVKK